MGAIAAIKARLEASATITDIVSTRIYNRAVPPTASYPYIVMRVSERQEETHLVGSAELAHSTVEIVCVGRENAAQLETLADAIRALLHMRKWTQGGVTVRLSRKESEADEYDAPTEGQNFGLMARIQTYVVSHSVAATAYP